MFNTKFACLALNIASNVWQIADQTTAAMSQSGVLHLVSILFPTIICFHQRLFINGCSGLFARCDSHVLRPTAINPFLPGAISEKYAHSCDARK